MISDAIALLDWPIAAEAADLIGLEWDEADLEEFEAAGDVSLCVDFGLDAAELIMICQDEDLVPRRAGAGHRQAARLRNGARGGASVAMIGQHPRRRGRDAAGARAGAAG